MDIDRERLQVDLLANAEHGGFIADGNRGRTILTGDPADEAVRNRFVARLRDAGLEPRIDPVGNITGRYNPSQGPSDAAPVAVGSHLDSVRRGGIFDGPLGVYAGLEAVRAIDEAGIDLERPIDVVCFTEEEGGRFTGQLGSAVATGKLAVEKALNLTDDTETTLADRLAAVGYRGEDTIDASGWDAWLELHIEQDTQLENTGVQVGIVEAIASISNCEVTIEGNADHAGATGMFERSDALAAMAEVVAGVEAAGREHALNTDGTAVATVGELSVEPDVRNIVPGEATARLDLRDVTDEGIHALVERVRQVVERVDSERPVDATMEHYRHDGASTLSERCIGAAERAAVEAAVSTMRLHSAGVHDTALVSDVTDAALLFAPSVDGISHNPREWTDWEDCAAATQALARTLVELAG
jgi:N-carbamoyl-L-amino-acid hydrolase